MLSKDQAICTNMLEAVNKIQEICSRFSNVEEFSKDYIHFDAAMMNFVVIGEMANKLSESFKEDYHEMEWQKICFFRNIIAHDYFGIDEKEVWQIIFNKLPVLKEFLLKILGE
ncbi:MAG: HepT-like ribonuclease domain-containing protein [Bacteroidota bacterium]